MTERIEARYDQVEAAIMEAALVPGATEQEWKRTVIQAAIDADNRWLAEVIREHALVDGWTLSTRNALLAKMKLV